MKTILVPLDHTTAAEHTLAYANKLAVRWAAEVVLVYCVPGLERDGATAALATQEQRLRSLVERLRYQQLTRQDGRRIQYQYRTRSGCLHDHVQAEAARCAADIVVMGMEHVDCDREEAPGNHAATISALVTCPVLVVPAGRRPLPSRLVFCLGCRHWPAPFRVRWIWCSSTPQPSGHSADFFNRPYAEPPHNSRGLP
jgi:nucleotide-binding universal stress UspA family protein